MQRPGVEAVQRGEQLAGLAGDAVPMRGRDGGPGRGQAGARELGHQHVTPAVLVVAAGQELRRGDGQPAVQVFKHARLDDAAGRGARRVELEHPVAADLVHGPGTVRVTAQHRARQAEAGRNVFRSGPDDLLVPDNRLPLLVRAHDGQHARRLTRATVCPQLNIASLRPHGVVRWASGV